MSIPSIKKIIPITRKLKILLVASEMAPFAKAGGLGDVVYSLSLALEKLGQDVRVMMPYYQIINRKKYKVSDEVTKLKVPTDQPGNDPFLVCAIKKYQEKKAIPTYFLENMEYYEKRANVYGYADDHIRWILLCRGVLEFLKISSWQPDLIMASDWQTGLISNYLKTRYNQDPILSKIATVFAIHNLQYQGMCDFKFMPETERDAGQEPIPDFFNPRLAKLNWLLRGVLHSDIITTVSPVYAKEILTPQFGEGLDRLFQEKREKIYGILNGINQEENNPKISSLIPFSYTAQNVVRKEKNKQFLQEKFGLLSDPNVFLVCMVTRLVEQKGFDLLEKIGKSIFKNMAIQLIVIGDGDSRYKELISSLANEFPEKIKYFFEFNPDLPHLVFSGADALLMPSKFEPCGLTQMQAMRYGCVPIVRKTGGLASTVEDFNPQKNSGSGFVFNHYEAMALYTALVRANSIFGIKKVWHQIVQRAMNKDFSWKHSAKKYIKVFQQVLQNKKI